MTDCKFPDFFDPIAPATDFLEYPCTDSPGGRGPLFTTQPAFWGRALGAAFASASMGVLDWDFRTGSLHCPLEFRERIGLEPGEPFGRHLRAADRTVFLESVHRALEGATPRETRRLRRGTDENSSRILAVQDAELERDGDGNPERLLVLARDLTRADEALQAVVSIRNSAEERVSETRTLLREMNHRVKNNLQIVCALIHSHSDGLEDPAARSSFSDIESRVRTIAHLHDRLAQGFGTLEAAVILRDLAAMVGQTAALGPQRLVLDLENASRPLGPGEAMPFAMAANELLMNSLQHGLPDAPVTVQLRGQADGALRLTVRNGIRAAPADPSPGLGTEIVRALSRQLGASFHSEFAWNEAASHLVLAPSKEAPRA